MKVNDLRKMNADELKAKETELDRELFNLRFQLHTGHLENSSRISDVRKTIARVKTLLRENRG
jgi:large subunit ribosomal protein L29